jgi:hypothetical protein
LQVATERRSTVDKECAHPEDQWTWASGEEGVIITLNSWDVECGGCGERGYFRDPTPDEEED